MPPPELQDRVAPMSVSDIVLEAARQDAPLERHRGPRAEHVFLRARMEDAAAIEDREVERESALALARLLASRGIDLDEATVCARRALALQDDPALRAELAGWLTGLGEPSLAAATMVGLADSADARENAKTLVRTAVLLGRANDPSGAADALAKAADADPSRAIALELRGALTVWAPDELSPKLAADAYLEAATRRAAAGEPEAAFEDLLRAVEVAPAYPRATRELVRMLTERGREEAADEVLRAHAAALEADDPEGARAVHLERRSTLADREDQAGALGAVFDANLLGQPPGDSERHVDELLMASGLYELLGARMEFEAEAKEGIRRSERYERLAQVYAGPLASPDRAIEAWIEAAASNPANDAAWDALRAHHESSSDSAPLLEAMIRVGLHAKSFGDPSAPRLALREMATFAEEQVQMPALASWALECLIDVGEDPERITSDRQRLAPGLRELEAELDDAQELLEAAKDVGARVTALKKAATLLFQKPELRGRALSTLAALVRADPTDRDAATMLDRLVARTTSGERRSLPDLELYESVLMARVEASIGRADLVRSRVALANVARWRGDHAAATDSVMALLSEAPGHRWGAAVAVLTTALAGRRREQATAITALAKPLSARHRAVLLAVAAEKLIDAGATDRAASTAMEAVSADPSCARALATLAEAQTGDEDRGATEAIERAMTVVVPKARFCDKLAGLLDAQGETLLALAWTQRWLALRPGDRRAITALLERAGAAGEAARLGDALSWVMAQPEPLGDLAEAFVDALTRLISLDEGRGLAVARRALDTFGPRVAVLRECLLDIAKRVGKSSLAIAVYERWVAAEPRAAAPLMLDLARRRMAAADFDGASRELQRALDMGGDPESVLALASELEGEARDAGTSLGSDGLIALAEARAAALSSIDPAAAGPALGAETAQAWRHLGALRCDLAEDYQGAEQALYAASEHDEEAGIARYVRDLCELAGAHDAIAAVRERASILEDVSPEQRASMFIEVGRVALSIGDASQVIESVIEALELDPSRSDAVAILEPVANDEKGLAALDRAYTLVAEAAMGRYGCRAAHYRGARQFEKRGAMDLAFRHAVAAFEAVPEDVVLYGQMARIADRVDDPSSAVNALERMADKGNDEQRAMWLKRAAALGSHTPEGTRMRLDVLLRAMALRPDVGVVEDLGRVLGEARERGEGGLAATGELEEALSDALKKLEGPDGARTAVALAAVVAEQFDAVELALDCLSRAIHADASIDEFSTLLPRAKWLARGASSTTLLERVLEEAERDSSVAGAPLFTLAAALAHALGENHIAAMLYVEAARQAPEDPAVVRMADEAVRSVQDTSLQRALDEAVPAAKRADALLLEAEESERAGEVDEAIATLRLAIEGGDFGEQDRDRLLERFRQILDAAGRISEADDVVRQAIDAQWLSPEAGLRWARVLANRMAERGEHREALELFSESAARVPVTTALLEEEADLARRADDPSRHAALLQKLIDATEDEAARIALLKRLASSFEQMGDVAAAARTLSEVARLRPQDSGAMEALEKDAQIRGDHDAVAAFLAQRISKTAGDDRRLLRLRRSAVLEQRLGRIDDAVTELSAIVEEYPDDRSAIPYLADLYERLVQPELAAPLWLKMSEIATDAEERADYGLRGSRSFLAAGNVDAAKAALTQVADVAPREHVVELQVELARRLGDAAALSVALDELSEVTNLSEERRVLLLLEASRAAMTAGDSTGALARARKAKKLAPLSPDAVLASVRLEYLARGTGTPREAQAAVDSLHDIVPELEDEHKELHAFLLAEELDVIQGGGAGMRELTRMHAEIGPKPLIALGMAERMVRHKDFEPAVPLFERALAGDLLGLRSRGRVVLAAAEAAANAGEVEIAAGLLEEAAEAPDTRKMAMRRQLELTAARGEPGSARRALEQLLEQTSGVAKARVLGQLGRLLWSTEPDQAREAYAEAIVLAKGNRQLRTRLREELAELDGRPEAMADSEAPSGAPPPSSGAPPPSSGAPPPLRKPRKGGASSDPSASDPSLSVGTSPLATSEPPSEDRPRPRHPLEATLGSEPGPAVADPAVDVRSEDVSTAKHAPLTDSEPAGPTEPTEPGEPTSNPPSSLPVSSDPPPPSIYRPAPISRPLAETNDEDMLFEELEAGDVQAGEELVALYVAGHEPRPRDVLAVRRRQVELCPGDLSLVAKLRDAAKAEHAPIYAKALDHVLRAFDPDARPVEPPSLSSQHHDPDLVRKLLFRGVVSPVHEALALACETGLFRKEASAYGIIGVPRVQPSPHNPLGQVMAALGPVLASTAVVFHQRQPGEMGTRIVLLSTPAIVLSGEVRERSRNLEYLMGTAFVAAMPEHALVTGLEAFRVRTLLTAIIAAFGPVEKAPVFVTKSPQSKKTSAEVTRIGGELWQLVPPRGERRLRAVCEDTEGINYETAVVGTQRAMRRAGLFACGDIATAIELVLTEKGLSTEELGEPDALRAYCEMHEEVADLVRVATRMEYAEARWTS